MPTTNLSDLIAGVGAGTVTSITLAVPAFMSGGSTITTAGTFTLAFQNQAANTVLRGPTSGGSGAVSFGNIVPADFGNSLTNNRVLRTASGTASFANADVADFANQAANTFAAAPDGSTGAITWRTMVKGDIDANNLASQILGWKATSNLTISASDVVTPATSTAAVWALAANSGTTDSVSYIDYSSLPDGRVFGLVVQSGHVITLVPSAGSPGANQAALTLDGNATKILKNNRVVWFQRRGNAFYEIMACGFNTTYGTGMRESLRPILLIPTGVGASTQGTTGSTTRVYKVTAVDALGHETNVSSSAQTTNGAATLTGANFQRITWSAVANAFKYNIYRTTAGGTPSTTGLIATVNAPTVTYDDTGAAGSGSPPSTTVLTGGPFYIDGDFSSDSAMTVDSDTKIFCTGNFTLNSTHTMTVSSVTNSGGLSTSAAPGAAVLATPQQGAGLGGGDAGVCWSTNAKGAGGGGHGGKGGKGASDTTGTEAWGGNTYTSSQHLMGSGGGGAYTATTSGGNGGNGGGALYLEVQGNVSISANITANGANGGNGSSTYDGGGGGGSGGGIMILCGGTFTLAGSTSITANGGNGGAGGSGGSFRAGGGGGGGGIVVIISGGALTNSGTVSATGGSKGTDTSAPQAATAGSAGSTTVVGNVMLARRVAP